MMWKCTCLLLDCYTKKTDCTHPHEGFQSYFTYNGPYRHTRLFVIRTDDTREERTLKIEFNGTPTLLLGRFMVLHSPVKSPNMIIKTKTCTELKFIIHKHIEEMYSLIRIRWRWKVNRHAFKRCQCHCSNVWPLNINQPLYSLITILLVNGSSNIKSN